MNKPFCRIGGMDRMAAHLNLQSRNTPEGGNFFTVITEEDETAPDDWQEKVHHICTPFRPLLNGCMKRPLPFQPLIREYGNEAEEDLPILDQEAEEFFLRRKPCSAFTAGCCGDKRLYKFSHELFDGIGAEKFIGHIHSGNNIKLEDSLPLAVPPQEIRNNGRKLGLYMLDLLRKDIAVLPSNIHAVNRFEFIHLTEEQTRNLTQAVEEAYGPFNLSLFLFAAILIECERLLEEKHIKDDCIMIPMSVDSRQKTNQRDAVFFNHWSLMPLIIERRNLQNGIPDAWKAVQHAYMDGISSRIAETFRKASDAMLYVPSCCLAWGSLFAKGATAGTMMFSFLESEQIPGVRNLFHAPVMPSMNPLGIFVNHYGNRLNLTVSHRMGKNQLTAKLLQRLTDCVMV